MRSEGSRFTLGVWGQGCVRQKLRLCPMSDLCRRSYIRVCRGGYVLREKCQVRK